jgi:hypothetical protein
VYTWETGNGGRRQRNYTTTDGGSRRRGGRGERWGGEEREKAGSGAAGGGREGQVSAREAGLESADVRGCKLCLRPVVGNVISPWRARYPEAPLDWRKGGKADAIEEYEGTALLTASQACMHAYLSTYSPIHLFTCSPIHPLLHHHHPPLYNHDSTHLRGPRARLRLRHRLSRAPPSPQCLGFSCPCLARLRDASTSAHGHRYLGT